MLIMTILGILLGKCITFSIFRIKLLHIKKILSWFPNFKQKQYHCLNKARLWENRRKYLLSTFCPKIYFRDIILSLLVWALKQWLKSTVCLIHDVINRRLNSEITNTNICTLSRRFFFYSFNDFSLFILQIISINPCLNKFCHHTHGQ